MGVRGLKSFVSANDGLLDPHELHDTHIIIDASNLMSVLFAESQNDRQDLFGGDLVKLARLLRTFFNSLKQCNVVPIMVFDGAQTHQRDTSKTNEKLRRNYERFERVQAICDGRHPRNDEHILAIVATTVYRSIIIDSELKVVQCAFEADLEVARLSNEYKCPAVSNDSDFILMDLPYGLIFADSLKLQSLAKATDPETKLSYHYIVCDIFKQDNFTRYFGSLRNDTLRLLGTLAGNDFTSEREFCRFCDSLPMRTICLNNGISCREFRQTNSGYHQRIIKILNFLNGKTINEAINRVCESVRKDRRAALKEAIESSLCVYDVPQEDAFKTHIADMYRAGYRQTFKNSPKGPDENAKFMQTIDKVVEWLKKTMEQSLLNYKVLDVINRSPVFIRPYMDDITLASAQLVFTRVYGLLLSLTASKRPDRRPCYLYDRVGHLYGRKTLEARNSINSVPIDYLMYDIPEMPIDDRYKIVLATFNCSKEYYISALEEYLEWFELEFAAEVLILQILMNSLDATGPKLWVCFRDAVWICVLFYTRDSLGGVFLERLKEDGAEAFVTELSTLISRLNYESSPRSVGNTPFFRRTLHQIAQVQSFIVAYNHINSFLGDVLARIRAENWLNCCLIYNLTRAMHTKQLRLPPLPDIPFFRRRSHDGSIRRGAN